MDVSIHEHRSKFGLRSANRCAQCGEHLVMPEWSEHIDARRVRHLWECDACGYSFETTVVLAAA